jgi:hypothetical protein
MSTSTFTVSSHPDGRDEEGKGKKKCENDLLDNADASRCVVHLDIRKLHSSGVRQKTHGDCKAWISVPRHDTTN